MIRNALRHWNPRLFSSRPTQSYIRTFASEPVLEEESDPLAFLRRRKLTEFQAELCLGPRKDLAAANIGLFYSEAKPLRLRNHAIWKFALTLHRCRRHVIHHWHVRYLEPEGHAMGRYFAKLYLEKNSDPLWFRCVAHTADAKAILRKKVKKRLNAAFMEALKRQGYDRTGRRLQQQQSIGGTTATSTAAAAQLYGTIDIRSFDPAKTLNVDYSELLSWMGGLVKALERDLGLTETGQRVVLPPEKTSVGRHKGRLSTQRTSSPVRSDKG